MVSRSTQGYAAATFQSVIIGFSFLFVVVALRSADPLDVLSWRFTFAFGAASLPLFFSRWRPKVNGRDLLRILPLALFYPVLFFALQTWGLVYVASSEAGIIQSTIPVFTLILATVFLGEKTSGLQRVFVGVSVCGVIFISVMKGVGTQGHDFRGIVLIFASTLSIAVYNVLAGTLARTYPVYTLTWLVTAAAFVIFLGAALATHAVQGTLADYVAPLSDPVFLGSVLYLGVLSSLVTSGLAIFAFARIEAFKVGVFSNMSVVVTILAGYLLLGDPLSWFHLVGAAAILVGIFGTGYFGRAPGQRPGDGVK